MQIDLDYVASFLNVFREAKTAHISVPKLGRSGVKVAGETGLDEKFLFHFQLASENGLISNRDGFIHGVSPWRFPDVMSIYVGDSYPT